MNLRPLVIRSDEEYDRTQRSMSEAGLLLLCVSAALAVLEAHVPTHGAIGAAAVAAMAAGLALVVAGAGVGTTLALTVGVIVAAIGGIYLWVVVHKALAARRSRVRSGPEGLIGRVGEVRAAPAPLGKVFLDGALWRARLWSPDDDTVLERGDPIVVERVDGLTLTVRRAEDWELF
jgi:membrane-bound ClpP family serine protease